MKFTQLNNFSKNIMLGGCVMSSYSFFVVFAFIFYYLFRKLVDQSLPIIPIIYSYKGIDDVINAVEIAIVTFVGGLIGYFIYWIIHLIS